MRMEKDKTMQIETDNALVVLEKLNDLGPTYTAFDISEEVYGFCCDSGYFGHEYDGASMLEVYWTVVNFGNTMVNDEEVYSFIVEWSEKLDRGYSVIDMDKPVYVTIVDNSGGEFTNRSYTIISK